MTIKYLHINVELKSLKLFSCTISCFIPPDLWLPNSPDVTPVDYKIWAIMQRRVYCLPEKNPSAWMNWNGGGLTTITDMATDHWRRRLRACVCSKGHFEHISWTDDINFVNLCHFQRNFCLTILIYGLAQIIAVLNAEKILKSDSNYQSYS